MTASPQILRCARCDSPWFAGQERCSECGGTDTVAGPASRSVSTLNRSWEKSGPAAVQHIEVTVTGVRLTWGDAFDAVFKIAVVLLIGQITSALLIYIGYLILS